MGRASVSIRLTVIFWLLVFGIVESGQLHGQFLEGKSIGGGENESLTALCVDGKGGFAVAGLTRSEGAGSNDLYVVKLDANGCRMWSKTFGIDVQEQAFWIESTEDGGFFVTGYCYVHPQGRGRQDFFMLKLNSEGDLEWQRIQGSNLLDVGLCGKPLVDGGYAALGISREGDTRGNFYFTKIDAAGQPLWYRIYDSPWVDYGHEFLKLPDGGFLLFGTESGFLFPSELDHGKPHADLMLIRVDALGNELWRKVFGGKRHDFGRSIAQASDGGFYLFGSTQNHGQGSFDMFLLKVNENGDTLWTKTFGSLGWDYGTSMDVAADGSLYLLGTKGVAGPFKKPDLLLVKADAEGNAIWSLELGGDSADYGGMVRALPGGGCALVGTVRSMGNGGNDGYFLMLTADGLPQTVASVEDSDFQVVVPNPVMETSEIRLPAYMGCGSATWEAFDVAGRKILSKQFREGESALIERSGLSPGVYFYRLSDLGKPSLSGKFIVY